MPYFWRKTLRKLVGFYAVAIADQGGAPMISGPTGVDGLRLQYTRWIRLGQLSGMVCAFLYMLAVATPLFLTEKPANALSWALYYEFGRTFSLLDVYGDGHSVIWMWFVVFMLSIIICFLDIRRERFFVSGFVLFLLLIITLSVIYVDFILQFKYDDRVAILSPWVKIAFFISCGNFMYLALRSRFFQYRRYRLGLRALRGGAS